MDFNGDNRLIQFHHHIDQGGEQLASEDPKYILIDVDALDNVALTSGGPYIMAVQVQHLAKIIPQINRFDPNMISIIVPLVSSRFKHFYNVYSHIVPTIRARLWISVDQDSFIDQYLLQKLCHDRTLNIFVRQFNVHLLTIMLGNHHGDLLFADHSLITPTKNLLDRRNRLNRHNDLIINPLNPLVNDLDIPVYQTFRKDRNKYHKYQQAIELAINDLCSKYDEFNPLNVLIIGPGLGDLVDITYKLSSSDNPIKITIIEKNHKVLPYLTRLNQEHWNHQVELMDDDVRNLTDFITTRGFDLIISEMLGSFGCNELFPEILLDIHLKIMIPNVVTAFISPIYSPLITTNGTTNWTSPFLNNLTNYYQLSDLHELWNWDYSEDIREGYNESELKIQMKIGGTINGIMGVFQADLYGDNIITNAKTYPIMFSDNYCKSWYPMIFPIDKLVVERDEIITVKFTRHSKLTVWYTWEVNGVKYNEDGVFSMGLC